MKKLILLFGFILTVTLSQGQEVAEYDDYYIYNSLIFSEKSSKIPLVDGVLFYYDNATDSTGLYFFDGNRFYGLTPDDSLDYYVSRIELNDSLGYYVSRNELVDTLLRYADTGWVQQQISDSLAAFNSSPWQTVTGGISYDNNITVGDTIKTTSFNINHFSDGLNNIDRTSVYVLDSLRATENITSGTDLTAFHMNTVIDSTNFTATGLNLRPIRNDYKTTQNGTQWVEGIGNYGQIGNSIDDNVYGSRNLVTIDAINNVEHLIIGGDAFGFHNQVINRQRLKQTSIDDLYGIYNKVNTSSGLAGGITNIENIYGFRQDVDEDADIVMNLSGNAYGIYLAGTLSVPNKFGIYEDFGNNYFSSKTTINDTLLITDATNADTVYFFDDGDTTRIYSDNPIKIQNNSLIVDNNGDVYVDKITISDSMKIKGVITQELNINVIDGASQSMLYREDTFKLTNTLAGNTFARGYYNEMVLDSNEYSGYDRLRWFPYTFNSDQYEDVTYAYGGIFATSNLGGNVKLFQKGLQSNLTNNLDGNNTDSIYIKHSAGHSSNVRNLLKNGAILYAPEQVSFDGFLTASAGAASGAKVYIDNGYGVKMQMNSDADIENNISNAYGLYVTGTMIADNMYGVYSNWGDNYFSGFTHIEDSLLVSDTARFLKDIYINGNLFDGTGGGQWTQSATEDTLTTPNHVVIDSSLVIKRVVYKDDAFEEFIVLNDGTADTIQLDTENYNYFFVRGSSTADIQDALHVEVLGDVFPMNFTLVIEHDGVDGITFDYTNLYTPAGADIPYSTGTVSLDMFLFNWIPNKDKYAVTLIENLF